MFAATLSEFKNRNMINQSSLLSLNTQNEAFRSSQIGGRVEDLITDGFSPDECVVLQTDADLSSASVLLDSLLFSSVAGSG